MWLLFSRHKRERQAKEREAKIDAVKKEIDDAVSKQVAEGTRVSDQVDRMLNDKNKRSTTYLFLVATGGERRGHGKQ